MEQKKSPSKDYRRQSPQYFLIGLIVALSTTLLAFEYRTSVDPPVIEDKGEVVFVLPDELPPVTLPKPKTPPPPPVAPLPPVPSPDPIIEPIVEPIVEPVVAPEPQQNVFVLPPEPVVAENTPIKFAEKMPVFPGSEPGLYEYLAKNTQYPTFPLENGIEAKLYVQFIVNKDGSVSDVEVLNPQGYGFDEEAKRVISQMPTWEPGRQGGKKVRVYYVIPINFALK
ncbi:MAG: energy transducer TonB [Salibacteraceae bacterium]